MASLSALHANTPTLTVSESRGYLVRDVSFFRADSDDVPLERVDRSAYDPSGRRVDRWDPRLWDAANQAGNGSSNVRAIHSLSGQVLLSDSVDAGCDVELLSEAGASVCRWGAKGQWQRVEYDTSLRPVAIFEGDDSVETCVERLTYGRPDQAESNRCSLLIRHDDPAGSLSSDAFSLSGELTQQTRRFLNTLDDADWPEALAERDQLLESEEGATTCWMFGVLGDKIRQVDAEGNTQSFRHTVAGQLVFTHVQPTEQAVQTLVRDIRYDAHGRIASETAGNGLVITLTYDALDGRLTRLLSGDGRLQDLHYAYDPVGNVVSIEDRAQPTRYFANQQIEPLRTFAYDTLYQLIEATGYESAAANRGPRSFSTATGLSNYTQRYEYDAGGNLKKMIHTGAQNHTRVFATAQDSNRTLLRNGDRPPSEEDIAQGFDASGNLRELAPGQRLSWDSRNQLSEVTPVERDTGADDSEVYRYDAAGKRLRKVRVTQAKAAVTHTHEVRYLPGLEIRTNSATGEVLHVIVASAGRSDARVLHWQAGRPSEIDNDQIRYSLSDHLGSSAMELDQTGHLISHEVFYPYGETARFAARSDVEAAYKTVRYSGKERDVTGLYYYGLRYYAPWLMRWVSPDPDGENGGINQFCFCKSSPIRYGDPDGAAPYDVPLTVMVASGLGAFSPSQLAKVRQALDISSDFVTRTRDELLKSRPGAGVTKAFDAAFGKLDEGLRIQTMHAVAEELDKQRKLLVSFGTPEADLEIELFDGPKNMQGAADLLGEFGDTAGNIRLFKSHVENDHVLRIAHTLVHETAHAANFARDTHYYHVPFLDAEASENEVKSWSKKVRQSLRRIARQAPVETGSTGPEYIEVMQAITEHAESPEQRKGAFLNIPSVRASLLRMNADTTASLVMATRLPEKWWRSVNRPVQRAS
ncbi:RHS repeat-associated core domain-containing protein [Pseudomonas sp. GD03842]|uniref:RHS repeat domain-containing protein n=1 Tax=Pseudomonas sp. GD03842 TaxID=2975385 RepID=UPI00244D3E85|nr:RHS repeat-associated core domain-containing protein [Pseudomonas sp. GD03842]MDH0746225.1 RHS repeat-associated core domain-containing protein [Pseudomonas sp. GD03842]